MAAEIVGKLADDFMEQTLSAKKPLPYDQLSGYQTAFQGLRYAQKYSNRFGPLDGGITMQEIDDKYYFPKIYDRMYWTPAFQNFFTDCLRPPWTINRRFVEIWRSGLSNAS